MPKFIEPTTPHHFLVGRYGARATSETPRDQSPGYPVFQSYDGGQTTHARAWFILESDAIEWANSLNARLAAGDAL